jgi:hypothetical protein
MDRRGSNTWLVAVLALAVGFLVALLIFGGDNNNSSALVDTTSATTATTTQDIGTSGTPATSGTTTGATTTSTTTAQPGAGAPQQQQPTVDSCIALWNQANNRGNQTFVVNLMSQQPIRVHVGLTANVPRECLVTIVANNGDAYVFPEGGGGTYPYAQAPGKSDASSLPAAQKTSDALEQSDGTLKAR